MFVVDHHADCRLLYFDGAEMVEREETVLRYLRLWDFEGYVDGATIHVRCHGSDTARFQVEANGEYLTATVIDETVCETWLFKLHDALKSYAVSNHLALVYGDDGTGVCWRPVQPLDQSKGTD